MLFYNMYTCPGIILGTQWYYYKDYEIHIPPHIIRMTEDIYEPFYDYFFKE